MKTLKISFGFLLSVVFFTLNSCVDPYQPVINSLSIYAPQTTLQLTYYSNDGKGGITRKTDIMDFTDTCCLLFQADVGKTNKILEDHPEYGTIDIQRISGSEPVYVTPVWFVVINDKQDVILSDKDYSVKAKMDALSKQTDLVTILNDNEVHTVSGVMKTPPPTIEL